MLVSHRKKFIYTKTVKTASTSVEVYFEKYCMKEGEWSFIHSRNEYVSESGIIGLRGSAEDQKQKPRRFYNHMPASAIKELIGENLWNDYFKFCVIRNPFEKVISGFFHFVINRSFEEPAVMIKKFRSWVEKDKGNAVKDRHIYMIDKKICMDFFIRHEKLSEGVGTVCHKLDIPFDPGLIPTLKNRYKQADIRIEDYYDNKCISIITKNYAFEFDYFNYNKTL